MANLNCIPAVGFETRKCNAVEYRATTRDNYAKINGRKLIPLDQRRGLEAISCMISTAGKILGYFPAIGSLIGLYRIYDACTDSTGLLAKNKLQHITRGVIEFLSLGFLLLLPDLINTFKR